MANTFDHFLITRFNIKSEKSNWKTENDQPVAASNDWLQHRLEIFEKYCLPSVVNQTNNNFTWLIYLDTDTPKDYKIRIDGLLKSFSFIKPIFVGGYKTFMSQYVKDVLTFKSNDSEFVITSRIDNDDVMHTEYINTVQKQFNNQDFMAVNFIKTYHYKIASPEKLFINFRFSNQFISLIERIKKNTIEGCYSRGDRFWNQKDEIIQISKQVYCMELIHQRNLLNDLNGFPVILRKDLKSFGINKKVNTRSLKDYLKLWRMSWKKYLIYLLKY